MASLMQCAPVARPSDAEVIATLRQASEAIQACRLWALKTGKNPGTLIDVELRCAGTANALEHEP